MINNYLFSSVIAAVIPLPASLRKAVPVSSDDIMDKRPGFEILDAGIESQVFIHLPFNPGEKDRSDIALIRAAGARAEPAVRTVNPDTQRIPPVEDHIQCKHHPVARIPDKVRMDIDIVIAKPGNVLKFQTFTASTFTACSILHISRSTPHSTQNSRSENSCPFNYFKKSKNL